jgi:hypothetical protein
VPVVGGAAGGQEPDAPDPPQQPTFGTLIPNISHLLDVVQQASNGTLPTSVSLHMAQHVDPTELHRAATLATRALDFVPDFLLERPKRIMVGGEPKAGTITSYADPVTGGEITFDTARRLLSPARVPVMTSILRRLSKDVPNQFIIDGVPKIHHVESTPGVEPAKVAAVLDSMSEVNPDLPWTQALGAAVQIARTDVNLDSLRQNIHMANTVPGMDTLESIAISHLAASVGIKFKDKVDVLDFAFPGAAPNLDAARRLFAQRKAAEDAVASGEANDPTSYWGQTFGGMSRAQATIAEAQDALRNATPSAQGAFLLLSGKQTARDFLASAKAIEKRYTLQDADFHDTLAGRFVGDVFDKLNSLYNASVGRAFQGRALIAGTTAAQALPGSSYAQAKRIVQQDWATGEQVIDGKLTIGQALTDDYHLPHWATPILDLVIAWELDPLIVAGKTTRLFRESKLLVDVGSRTASVESRMARVREFTSKPLRGLKVPGVKGNVSLSDFFVHSAARESNPDRFFMAATNRLRTRWEVDGFDRTLAAQIYDYTRSRMHTQSLERISADIQQIIPAAFGGKLDGAADFINRERAAIDRAAQQRAFDTILERYHGHTDPAFSQDVQRETERMVDQQHDDLAALVLDDWESRILGGPSSMHEIPYISRRSGVMSFLRNAGVLDTGPAQSISALFNKTPSFIADLEGISSGQRVDDWARYMLRRGRVHTQQEQAWFTRHFAEIADPGVRAVQLGGEMVPREQAFRILVQKLDRELTERIAKKAGYTADQAQEIADEAMVNSGEANRMITQVYGVTAVPQEGGGVIFTEARSPLGPTQLLNKMAVNDPVQMRRILMGSALSTRRLENAVRKVFGGQARTDLLTRGLFGSAELRRATSMDRIERGWRALVVTRPAYVTRVVLLDENLRFAATLGWASHFEATKTGALIRSAVDRMFGNDREVTVNFEKDGEVGPASIKIPRPGRLDKVPGVSVASSGRALAETMDQESKRILDNLRDTSSWTRIEKGDPAYYSAWARALNKQFGQDPLLGRMLDDVVEGRTFEESVARQTQFLRDSKEGKAIAFQMQMTPENLESAMEQRVRTVRAYAAEDPGIASAALSGNVTPDLLRGLPEDRHPFAIHGPQLEATRSKPGMFGRLWNGYRKAILEMPTDTFNRHPYAKAWKTAATKSMLEEAAARGQTVTEELTHKIAAESDQFAREQVRRIMFDFRQESRIGEMVRFWAPFMQPWLEAYQVWGRIISQNPAMVGYAYEALKQGQKIGFFRKDPDTGQLVVPMSWWMGAAPLLHVAFGGQWSLSAPLQSFNLFFSTSFPVPTGGFGGDIPFPIPGLSPWGTFIVQKAVESGALPVSDAEKARLMSWAFQYGPVGPGAAVPRWLYYAYLAITGGAGLEGATGFIDSTADDFLRLQQLMGIHARTDEPPDGVSDENWRLMDDGERMAAWNTWLANSARGQALEFLALRAIMSLFFPAAPQISTPSDPYQAELRSLQAGPLGYEKGTQAFLTKYPNLSLQTIPKTMWDRQIGGLQSLPATKAVGELTQLPGFKEFAQRHPELLYAIIPSELRDGKFDIGTYYAQIAQGYRSVFSPEDTLANNETQQGWDAYSAAREQHDSILETQAVHADGTPAGAGNLAYDREAARWRLQVEDMHRVFPEWGKAYDSLNSRGLDPKALHWARIVAKDPMVRGTQTGKWLNGYLPLLDHTLEEMRANNIHTLGTRDSPTKAPFELGISKAYWDGVDALNKQYPDGEILYNAKFTDALSVSVTKGEQELLNVPGKQFQRLAHTWQRWEALNDAPALSDPGPDKEEAFLRIRQMADSAFTGDGPNWLLKWWHQKDPLEKQDYQYRLVGRPYEFLSRFDRQVILGEPTNDAAEQKWLDLANQQLQISKLRDAAGAAISSGPLYDALDLQVQGWANEDPVFGKQVRDANTWGFMVEKLLPKVDPGSDARPYWDSFLTTLRNTQFVADMPIGLDSNNQPIYLHGDGPSGDIDPNKKAMWNNFRHALETYRDTLFQESPQFRREWKNLEDINGYTSLIDQVFPDTYYPLGGAGPGALVNTP